MPSPTDRRVRLTALLLLTACTSSASPTPTPGSSAAPSMATPSPTDVATTSHSPAPVTLFTPGQPYAAADILEAMATTPRPDGVPAQLQTDAIAAAVAAAIWTFDGARWDTIVAEGTCGASCTLEVAGTRAGATGEDLWVFTVDPSSGAVDVTAAEARAIPDETVADLDEIVRALDPAGRLDGLALTSVAWQPLPDEGRFALSYRSGGEEGSCSADLLIDARDGRLLDESFTGC